MGHRKDSRWLIVEPGKTFVEPDERLAVQRFRQWEAQHQSVEASQMSVPIDAFE